MAKLFPACLGAVLCLALIMPTLAAATPPAEQTIQIGTIKVVKSVPSISPSDVLTVQLTIQNNGSVPITEFEVYEYFNSLFTPGSSGVITQPSGQSTFGVSASRLASAVQQIIDPPPPNDLQPGQTMTINYMVSAPGSGDYLIPASLIWYSYAVGATVVRTSVYSNGVVVHIPTQAERIVLLVYPYFLAATTFTVTITILLWVRRKLSELEEKRLSKENGPAI